MLKKKLYVYLFVVVAIFDESSSSEGDFMKFSCPSTKAGMRIIDLDSIMNGMNNEELSAEDRHNFEEMRFDNHKLSTGFLSVLSDEHLLGFNNSIDKMNYRNRLLAAIGESSNNPTGRDTLIAFLIALQYKQKKTPDFTLDFVQGSSCCMIPDTRHALFGDSCSKMIISMSPDDKYLKAYDAPTVGFLPTGCNEKFLGLKRFPNPISFSSALIHEFGHAVHSMLNINAPYVLSEKYMQSNEMKKFAFPFLNIPDKVVKTEIERNHLEMNVYNSYYNIRNSESISFREAEKDIPSAVLQSLYEDNKKCTDDLIKKMPNFLKLPQEIDKELSALNPQKPKFSSATARKILKYMAMASWSKPEEINQMLGIAQLRDTLFVNRLSDFNSACTAGKPFRFSHFSFPYHFPAGKLDFSPSREAMNELFGLHGCDFNDYLARVQAQARFVPPLHSPIKKTSASRPAAKSKRAKKGKKGKSPTSRKRPKLKSAAKTKITRTRRLAHRKTSARRHRSIGRRKNRK
ncbi:hypothetical protein FACS1894126_1640 [Alphaproteobacteria bacterium]|nr:hypothetical protein FACS1894126_1640 [Alphaproteobacteria bacterium]